MSKLDKLRKALLGEELYNKCAKYGIREDELQSRHFALLKDESLIRKRLEQLDVNYNYLKKCSSEDFAKLCGLKSSDNKISCLDEADKNSIYYDTYKENYYYDIVEINCSKSSDRKLLKVFQTLEEQQKNEFTDYLSLSQGCDDENKYVFYVAFNDTNQEIGGVCLISEFDGYVEVKYLTSRAAKTKSPLYKGIGNLILNYIVNKYNNGNYFGIFLISDPDAVGFYEKYGFRKMKSLKPPYDDGFDNYFLTFPIVKDLNIIDSSNAILSNYLNFALIFELEDIALKLKEKGIVPVSNDRKKRLQYLTSRVALKHFVEDLNLTQADFNIILENNELYFIPYFIDLGFAITEEEIFNLFKGRITSETVEIMKSLINQNYQFQIDYINFIGNAAYEQNNYDALKLCIDLGFLIKPKMNSDIKIKLENVNKIYNLISEKYNPDIWKQ